MIITKEIFFKFYRGGSSKKLILSLQSLPKLTKAQRASYQKYEFCWSIEIKMKLVRFIITNHSESINKFFTEKTPINQNPTLELRKAG